MSAGLNVQSAALYAHPTRAQAIEVARDLASKLETVGVAALASHDMAGTLELEGMGVDTDELAKRADLAIAIGGDGTMLHAFSELTHVPLVGINCGELGFLADVAVEERGLLAEEAAAGELDIDERLILETTYRTRSDSPAHGPLSALNDVTLQKGVGRAPYLEVRIDATPYASFLADSLVLATPTGSTAYNFSAGGPLLSPTVAGYVLTPVAPHSLWDRSVVLDAASRVEIEIVGDRNGALIVDGRDAGRIEPGGVVEIGVGAPRARLVRWERPSFIRRVHDTFNLDRTRK